MKLRDAVRATLPILLIAFAIRGATLLLLANGLDKDPDAYWRLAANLVQHGTFGQNDVPTAFRPPVYPLALTGCVAFGQYGRLAVGLLHLLLGLATVAMTFALGKRWGLPRCGAALAAILVACDPILLAGSAQVMTETVATFLATAGLLALTWTEQRKCAGVIAGIILGLAALCRPALLLWALAAGAALWWQNRQGRDITDKLRFPWPFALGLLIVLSPWAIRNQLQFGRPIVTTTHGGYTLLLANNPEFYDWLRNGPWGSVWNANHFNAAWDNRRPTNELQADRQAYDEAWQTISHEPTQFSRACLVRIGRFWSPMPHQLSPDETPLRRLSRYAVALWYLAEFALAIVGLWQVSRYFRLFRSPWFYGVLLIGCLLAGHIVYWTDMRMRAPLMPVVALFAAGGIFRRPETSLDENILNK